MLKQDKQESKRPYILEVEEKYARCIVVWADNVFEALEKAEELHEEGSITLGIDNYAGHKIQRASVKATDLLLSLLKHYGKDDEID